MTEATPEAVPLKAVKRVHPSRFSQAEVKRNVWYVVPEQGTPLSAVLDPDYWANNASRLRPNDRIEVDAEDGAYTATLFVRSVSRLSAVVSVLSQTEFDPIESKPLSDDFKIMWKGPIHKHAIVRITDEKTVLQGGFDTKETAMGWLSLNSKSIAA